MKELVLAVITTVSLVTPASGTCLDIDSKSQSMPLGVGTAVQIRAEGADPWVVQHQGTYYYTQTTGSEVRIFESPTLLGLADASPKTVWKPGPLDGALSKNVWAPEIHQLDGQWYIYFAADDGDNRNHRVHVLESPNPAGPYEYKARLKPANEDTFAIDGTILDYHGSRYFVWSGWPGMRDGLQNLYIAKMENPWTLEGGRVLLSTPSYSWESWINEGPQVMRNGDKISLFFSANRSWSNEYAIGELKLVGDDPMLPGSWRKTPQPIMSSYLDGAGSIYAPGHCSIVSEVETSLPWIFYHVAKRKDAGWSREVRAQIWRWGEFNIPLPLRVRR